MFLFGFKMKCLIRYLTWNHSGKIEILRLFDVVLLQYVKTKTKETTSRKQSNGTWAANLQLDKFTAPDIHLICTVFKNEKVQKFVKTCLYKHVKTNPWFWMNWRTPPNYYTNGPSTHI